MAVLRGQVTTGIGNYAYWMERLADHYERKTGMRLFPGTLNVTLPEPYSVSSAPIRLDAEEYGGRVSVSIVPCSIFRRRAFLLRTDANENGTGDHSRHILEIASDVKLRNVYDLRDGDWVDVEIT
ncbi:MAG: DUF120 domain-containing protein [Bryobacteraceae bacterium]